MSRSLNTKQMQLADKVQLVTALARELTGDQFKVAHALLLRFHNSQTGKCYPSYRQLAEVTGTSPPTAVAALKNLKALGVVVSPHQTVAAISGTPTA